MLEVDAVSKAVEVVKRGFPGDVDRVVMVRGMEALGLLLRVLGERFDLLIGSSISLCLLRARRIRELGFQQFWELVRLVQTFDEAGWVGSSMVWQRPTWAWRC